MPGKNAMRDNVSAVRSRLPHLSNLSREKIELALLYYESNVDETVEAFKRNGAIEALSGWTEMNNNRGNNSTKRTNNKSGNRDNKSLSQTPPSNGILRPSQRVSNIFQTFAEGGIPTITTNGNNTATYSPSSLSSSSLLEQSNNNLQSCLSTDLSFHPYLSQDSTANHSESSLNTNESTRNEYHDTSNVTTNSSTTTDEINLVTNHIDEDNESTNGHNGKLKRRKNIRHQNGSATLNHEQTEQVISDDTQQTTTVTKPSSTNGTAFTTNNRKILTKSSKDLQRQTSTLTNVELSFENEIKSSIKRIDDVFKQMREIINEREIELYLEMDKVKEQGLNIIHRRQQRAGELRQRVDSCERLEPLEIDLLRTDIKHFVTDGRYDLCEELTSSHRFEYDQTLIETLKTFGTVLRVDRKHDRARTLSTSSALVEQNGTSSISPIENNISEKSIENNPISLTNDRVLASNEFSSLNHQQPLPQRISNKQKLNGNIAGDSYQNSYVTSQTNGHYQHYDDSNNYQTVNRRRVPPQQQQQYPSYHNGNHRRARAIPSSNSTPTNNNQNNRRNGIQNSETSNTYRRPRPPPPQTMISPISN
ncbi:hypothetical protein I4U23_020807 [Adineta vaga]|nr:hypothetical protein I4U23_020807 [Adineta vaga]